MKQRYHLLVCVLLAACSSPTPETDRSDTVGRGTVQTDLVPVPAEWPGYYTGIMHTPDLTDVQFALWVRSDSTFVRHAGFVGRDSIPQGIMGQWNVVNGCMALGATGDKPDLFRYTAKGLLMVDETGGAFTDGEPVLLDKLADGIGDAIPRMRLKGTFTYMADAQSFRPCGSAFVWPCAGGMDMGEEEGDPLVKFNNVDLQKAYLKAVKTGGDPWVIEAICTMGMGPAMEGDGADEYVYIEQAPRSIDRCP